MVTTLANFIQVVTNLNAQTMITVNYGTGTPNEAAAWVAYVNATTNNPQYLGVDSTGIDWQTAGYWASLARLRAAGHGRRHEFSPHLAGAAAGVSSIGRLATRFTAIGKPTTIIVPHDPYTYAVRAQEYISLMKAVDPTIKIGVVAIPGVSNYINNTDHPAVDPVTQQTYYGWTPVLLATLAGLDVTPDFAISPLYPEDPG